MKLLLSASSLVALLWLLTCGKAPQGLGPAAPKQSHDRRLYVPPDKSFSAEFPCDPEQENVSATSRPIYEYTCGGEDASGLTFFTVSVLNMTDAEREGMRDEAAFERSVRDSISPKHRLVRLTPLQIEGGYGREFVSTNEEDDMDNLRGRAIVVGGRRYEVSIIAADVKALETASSERFFASFKPLR